MDQQIVNDIECTRIFNKKTLGYSFTLFVQYIAFIKIIISQYALVVNYPDNTQSTRTDCFRTTKNITARIASMLRVKYAFAYNYCLEEYIVLYKRYLDGTAISLGFLFFLLSIFLQ